VKSNINQLSYFNMKKVLFFALTLLCMGAAFGQSKPRVAVYATGDAEPNVKKVVASKLLLAITKSEEYFAVERMDEFLTELNKEHDYQHSGAVDDKQIIALGKKWGANYVCVAEVSRVYESTFVSARLIRVITGEVTAVAERYKKVNGMADLDEIAEGVAEGLLDVSLPKAASSGKTEELPKTLSSGKAASVKIGGVTWAATNVDDYQTFAPRPDMYTKFYEWGSNPCPAGWRVPTRGELIALDNAGTTWAAANERGNAVAGRFYGASHASCSLPNNMNNCVFLPAVGMRFSSGTLDGQGSEGSYWSATQIGNAGRSLSFSSTYSYPNYTYDYGLKTNGYPIRCVQ
jgi:uncharacterized protein (TIGR02145 family)